MFNVIIIGGEYTSDYDFFMERCIKLLRDKAKSGEGITIYTTGDEFVEKFASQFHIDMKKFNTNWELHGKDALKVRNGEILKDANALIYFNTGKKDNECLYNYALKQGINCRQIKIKLVD